MGISAEDLMARADLGQHGIRTVTLLPDPEPRRRWATIFSVDDHVVEPPDIFEGRFPKRYADNEPRIIDTDNGGQAWLWLDKVLPNVGFNAVAGRAPEEYTFDPARFEHMRRGAWDVHERVKDMDINGVWASVCFPSFLPGFVGQRLTMWPDDPELALIALRAYNDWHLEAWCGAYPDRLVPNQLPYLRDPIVAAEEIRRNAERGFKAVTFSEAPHRLGLPSIHTRYWEPFFAACEETETVINLHVGSAGETPTTSAEAPAGVIGALFSASSFTYAVDWLYSGIPARFPRIKICMSEGGIGWVAAVIDRVDHLEVRAKRLAERLGTESEHPTSDMFRRNFWFCALDEPSGFVTGDVIGFENILVESDYPHSDSTWPDTQPLLEKHLAALSPKVQRMLCYENAVALYRHTAPPNPLPELDGARNGSASS
jgi:predicted TIM-barrel fold metal-dependent hydrolase